MIAALENAIRGRGYYTMLRAAQTAAEIHRISQTWNAVGLIVMGLQANQCRELMQVTRKPIVSGEEELERNPRARSAKLRICEKL